MLSLFLYKFTNQNAINKSGLTTDKKRLQVLHSRVNEKHRSALDRLNCNGVPSVRRVFQDCTGGNQVFVKYSKIVRAPSVCLVFQDCKGTKRLTRIPRISAPSTIAGVWAMRKICFSARTINILSVFFPISVQCVDQLTVKVI